MDEAARVLAAPHTRAQIEFRLLDLAEFLRSHCARLEGVRAAGDVRPSGGLPSASGATRSVVAVPQPRTPPGPNPASVGVRAPQVGHSGPLRHQDAALEPRRQRSDWPALAARLHEDEAHRVAGQPRGLSLPGGAPTGIAAHGL